MRSRPLIFALAFLALAGAVFAQGNPTGTITGQVMDPDGLVLPGVTVTAASPVLQGVRTVVTSANGDYIIPFLPAGDYTVTFELQGFATVKQTVGLKMADTLPVNVKLAVATVTETVTVTGASTETAMTPTVATTIKASTVENIPWGRTLDAATVMAPAAIGNGPGGNIMISGALSYDNLNLVNGVNVNENLRQQARPLYVEDAVQETKVSTGNISAEYGRFQGGVVNMITKSGGNNFSGSFRTTFTNDGWKALTPYPGDANIDQVVPAYEMTFGGPVLKDKLWFFTSGRYQNNKTNLTMAYTGYNYTYATDDTRLEGKATYALTPRNNFKFSYFKRNVDYTNNSFGTVMDAASLYNNKNRESLMAANYQWVATNSLFLDTQYSGRRYDNTGTGSQYTDLIKGTPIWDRLRGTRFNTATYCAVCDNAVDKKNNDDFYVKLNYFLSTKSTGSHNFVAGFDYFDEMRMNNQNSVASGYRVQVRESAIVGYDVYPIVVPGSSTASATYIDWRPVFQDTVGNHLTTYSTFLNDVWRMNNQLTMNLGLRYDKNSTQDQGGNKVGNDSAFSPRLGVTWDMNGSGKWIANLGYGHYVGMFNTQIADAASPAGRESNYSYWYQGPAVNTTGPPYKTSAEALQIVWDWFFANGGTTRPVRTSPTVVGVNTSVDPKVKSSNSDEVMVGLARQLGNKGAVRVDYVYRKYHDFYGNFVNLGTGEVVDPRTGLQVQHDGGEQHRRRRARLQRRERPVRLSSPPGPHAGRQLHAVVVAGQRGGRGRDQRRDPRQRQRVPGIPSGRLELPPRLHQRRPAPQDADLGHVADAGPAGDRHLRPGRHAALRLGRAVRLQLLDRPPPVRDQSGLPRAALQRDLLRDEPRRVPFRRLLADRPVAVLELQDLQEDAGLLPGRGRQRVQQRTRCRASTTRSRRRG